jgi:AraC family transcriptional regulator, regulatory protein of adaptative response / methylated-DNA-[protein]-cysteine methyltransferase
MKATSTTLDPRWDAVVARDRAADGRFVYAVATTGVYCRPSCAARRPNPRNVTFHATTADAIRAGFRPCKRCRPDGPPLEQRRAALVADACRLIERAETAPRLGALARRAGLSVFHFHRVFKSVTGVTPKAYAAARRRQRVRGALKRRATVTEAIFEAGFNSGGRFYAASERMLGMTPTDFRAGGAHAQIRFAVGECSLGSIAVAASERGVCAILLGDDPDALVADLQRRFPRASFVGGDRAFERTVARVVGLIDNPGTGLDLPLDVRGTAFQQRVWDALRAVPPGSTTTYAAVAARIGAPGAARGVARACAANPIAVAIPCHRVIRQDGGLAGYRWGVERKAALLKKEGVA